MDPDPSADRLVYAGDLDGLNRVYTDTGRLIPERGEMTIKAFLGCDIGAFGTWRPVFAKRIISPYAKPRSSRLHVTSRRIVLVRDVDIPREVNPLMFPEGFVAAHRKEIRLREILSQKARYYCVIRSHQLSLVSSRVRKEILFTKLLGRDGSKYAVFFHTDPTNPEMIPLIKAQFQAPSRS